MTNAEWIFEAEEAMQDFDSPAQAMAAYREMHQACLKFIADHERYNVSSLRTWTFAGVADMRAAVAAIAKAEEGRA